VIPARGGSKRIPRKNIRLFHGQPMLAYAIRAAQASCLFDDIVVSSDDAEILELARTHGAEPLARPANLADDHTGTAPVVAHAITVWRQGGLDPDPVCCIYPGVPLLQPQDLVRGLALLEGCGEDYAFPVLAFPSAIQRALRLGPDGRTAPLHPEYEATRTQDLEPAFHDAGQFYWGRAEAWLAGRRIHSHGCGLPIPAWRAVDIDTPEDWQRAELIYAALTLDKSTP